MVLSLPPDERLHLVANRSCASPALPKCSQSCIVVLHPRAGRWYLRFAVETFVSFLLSFCYGVAPGAITSRFCNSLSAAPRFVSFLREPLVAPPRCTPHDVPPWNIQRGSKALPALLAGLVTKGYRMGESLHFMVGSIATNFHYGATLATLGI